MDNDSLKPPKKAKKALKYFHELCDYIEYYMGKIPKEVGDKMIYVEEIINDLSIDKKVDHRRLAQKLKAMWEKEKK